ncbi:MAG: hypothetical protein GTN35_05920 [Nitrososphaeria archaeon]|nr:hypothetical protein [Nitrosopumilaceae archaeon]NIP09215.1 hypothetical protein [Nitrosopumilaceae archaeon]NIP91906.1 hypothetical protein [Nitrososphaeria archaeon]NIS95999.1 hypothetical protein [Nitrosopumilaceae archaeon]
MKEYFLQSGEMTDIPGYKEEKQTVVDESQVNQAFEPANDAFSGLRDLGDWVIEFFTELFSGAFGNIM